MTKTNNQKNLILLFAVTIALLVYGVFTWISGQDGVIHTYNNPVLTDSPIYKELPSGDSVTVTLLASKPETISGITILPVNLDQNGTGSINVKIENKDETTFFTQINERNIIVGEWNRIPVSISLTPEEETVVTLTAVDCNPFFMYAPDNDVTDSNFAVGTYRDEINRELLIAMLVKLGIILVAYSIVLILILANSSPVIGAIGNDMFLVLVFAYICIGIFSAAFQNGVFITADSAGYLREAVNLRAGNGFAYDGLAGYNSWFANWPILYPLMITGVMFISGLDAYLSSKIVSAVLVLAILIVLRVRFGKNAWIYSIALLNLGFVKLSFYTWSEIPFILFMLLFALKLGDIVDCDPARSVRISDYVLLGIYGVLAFLTRYFGIYVWAVVGGYIFMYLVKRIKTKEKLYFWQGFKLAVTALISGMISLGYLFLNKMMNGMPSGVSRSTWWDDYRQLTVDLFNSLITEVFNVFHIDCSSYLRYPNFYIKAAIVAIILGLLIWRAVKNLKTANGIYSPAGALLILGGSYYVIFTVIRYFSSMDTFYFRFFEPASFMLTIGFVMILINVKDMSATLIKVAGVLVAMLIIVGGIDYSTEGMMLTSGNYYDVVKAGWNRAYSEIPTGSVVIFSDLDYRSLYYRPDVVEGEISSADTWETIQNRFYASQNLVIQREYAESMIECGEYDSSVSDALSAGLTDDESKYICIGLRGN